MRPQSVYFCDSIGDAGRYDFYFPDADAYSRIQPKERKKIIALDVL